MKYTEFREKLVDSFIAFAQSGISIDDIGRCCHMFGILAACLSFPDEIKDEDVFDMFIYGYAAAKENNPVDEVIKITIPKKST